ncbi:zinc ribbon domain-containing protein [uncultured Pseudoflavonifractor sp.]|uniref:zinc ribbon domain-containing protein n=1 Tax=uncultured Pseudoflavonifractor sp. TaxID=1221379 RepID=UPI0025DA1680|nr:zinc ribbon domain-containing protein [uncultured Pseudoflavonifractor sp.]
MFCTKCGAPLKDGLKFCTSCGAKVENPAAQAGSPPPPRTGTRVKGRWRAAAASAALTAVTLAAALGVFLWAAAPRTSTPEGSLALLVESLADGDGLRAAQAMDLTLSQLTGMKSMTAAQGQSALLSALQLPQDTDVGRRLQSARLITATVSYTNPAGTACQGSALVRLTWADGTQTTALLPDAALEYDGGGWHIISGLGPII